MEDTTKKLIEIPRTFYFSNQRVKLCGFYMELSRYGRDRMIGNTGRLRKKDDDEVDKSEPEKLTAEEIRKKNMQRASKNIADLILCNAWQWHKRNGDPHMPVFITFTFRENVEDLNYANKEFTNFIRRFSYDIRGKMTFLKYLVVIEFQERGAIHYHAVFFNLPWIDRIYDKVISEWRKGVGEGAARVESVKSEEGLIKYLCKYLTKSIEDGRLQARKSHFGSKGLKKPLIHSFDEVVNVVRAITPNGAKIGTDTYEHEYLKSVTTDRYYLKNYPEIFREIKVNILEKYSS